MRYSSKLEVWKTLSEGWLYPLQNVSVMVRASGLSYLFFLIISFFSIQDFLDFPSWLSAKFLGVVMFVFASSHIAVAVHRAILLNETEPKVFRFGRPEFFYCAAVLCFSVLYGLPDAFFDYSTWTEPYSGIIISFLLLIINIYIMVILPSIAISDHKMNVRKAWAGLAGSRLRFLFIVLLNMILPILVIDAGGFAGELVHQGFLKLVIEYEITHAPAMVIFILLLSVLLFGFSLILGAMASVLSVVYRFISYQRAETDDGYEPPSALSQFNKFKNEASL
jgi:hypothetical protein